MAKAKPGDVVAVNYLFDESQALFVAADDWTRDDAATETRLLAAGVTITLDVIAGWTDDDVQLADCWALGKEAGHPVGDFPTIPSTPPAEDPPVAEDPQPDPADPTPPPADDPPPAAETPPADDPPPADPVAEDPQPEPTPDDPTPPQADPTPADPVAGDGAADPVADGGDNAAGAGDPPAPVDPGAGDNQPSTGLEDGARECLTAMRDSKYGLYRHKVGEGESRFGVDGPEYDGEMVRDLVEAGLASVDVTGGSHGSVKITDAGRAALGTAAVA